MATYPTDPGYTFDDPVPLSPPRVDVSDAGGVYVTDLATSEAVRITVQHPLCTAAERATLRAFYAANRDALNQINLGGETYNVRFASQYRFRFRSGTRFDGYVDLVGTRA